MVTQAATLSLMFWIAKRPFQSFCGPSRLAVIGRYTRCDPAPVVTVSPAMAKLPPRKTSFAIIAATGWSVDTIAEPWKPAGRLGLSRWKKVQPLPGNIVGQLGEGQRSLPAMRPCSSK